MQSRKVLIVDDERTIRNGCRMVLEERGMTAQLCENGKQCLGAANEGRYDAMTCFCWI